MPRGRSFNTEHTKLIVRWYEKLGSTRATAEHLHCSRGTVIRHLRHAGIEMRPGGRPKKSDD